MNDQLYRDYLKTKIPETDELGRAKRAELVAQLPEQRQLRSAIGQAGAGPFASDEKDFDVRLRVGYQTGTGNRLSLQIDGLYLDKESMPLLTLYEMVAACGDCHGSNGGCPSFSPRYSWLGKTSQDVFVVSMHIDMAWAMRYSKAYGERYSPPFLMQLSYADRLTENYMRRLMTKISEVGGGRYLGLGNCFGCRPKECTVLKGLPCKTPHKRSFSMEAVGVDCDALHLALYGDYLPWYYKGSKLLPTYMSRYCAFFCESRFSHYVRELAQAVYTDKSFVRSEEVPALEQPPTKLYTIGTGVHKGYRQWVYEVFG